MKCSIIQWMFAMLLSGMVMASCSRNRENASQNREMNTFISNLMDKMTLEEKIGQLNLITPGGGIPTGEAVSTNVEEKIKEGKVGGIFGVTGPDKVKKTQSLAVEGSRLKIPLLFGLDVIHGYKTTFPVPWGLSFSWDMKLIEKTARIAAREATADGLNWTFSPMVDITRDPRWGRVAEGSGEDPYLGAEIARAMVRGYQADDLASDTTMLATVKHFALYGASEAGRDYNTVDMSRLRMFNDYFPPYKSAVDAGVGSVMSSFNDVDGIPSTGNKWLLTELLRKKWGFDGFVVSDYTSLNEMIAHGLGDLKDVSALALKAGLDMDMVGEGFLTTLKKSLDGGWVSEADIDNACRRILEAKYKLGLFDDPYRYVDESLPYEKILTENTRAVSRDAAVRSMVLLKNKGHVLPLQKQGVIALVGPLANDKNNMLGTWAVSGDPQTSVSVFEGIKNVGGGGVSVRYAKGSNISDDPELAEKVNVFGSRILIDDRSPKDMLSEALQLSARADVIVAVVGEASEMSGESSSRSEISLPESQKKLIRALKKAGKPLVLVMMSGRPLTMAEEYKLADAIVFTGHPGVEAGNAVADVLFGNYNPAGKLTMTFPRNMGQIPVYYRHRTTGRPNPGDKFQKFRSNYLDVENSPLFPFGYGLSYSSFRYSDITLDKNTMKVDGQIKASVTVTNTGSYAGEETVQLYIRDVVCSITRPVKELKDFRKIFLKPGESGMVEFTITKEDLMFCNFELKHVTEPGEFKLFIGSSSEDVQKTSFTLME
jgi:beta-glucosidase